MGKLTKSPKFFKKNIKHTPIKLLINPKITILSIHLNFFKNNYYYIKNDERSKFKEKNDHFHFTFYKKTKITLYLITYF